MKNLRFHHVMAILAIIAFANFGGLPPCFAKESKSASPAQPELQAPIPGKEHQLLQKLVGNWEVTITMRNPDGSMVKGSGTIEAASVSDGFGVSSRLRANIEGLPEFSEGDLWGFDANTKTVHFYSVVNFGAVHDHVGQFTDDNTLKLRWEGLHEGKPATEDITITFIGKNEIRVHEIDTSEGRPGPVFDFVCKRRAHS